MFSRLFNFIGFAVRFTSEKAKTKLLTEKVNNNNKSPVEQKCFLRINKLVFIYVDNNKYLPLQETSIDACVKSSASFIG